MMTSDPTNQPTRIKMALVGNPNTGKTTLFNRLCGQRSHTANLPGSTVQARTGTLLDADAIDIVDLPGQYGLHLDRPESVITRAMLHGAGEDATEQEKEVGQPDGVVVVVDATNLTQHLTIVGQVLQYNLPTVIALNMMDEAPRRGVTIDVEKLQATLGCAVVAISAKRGDGCDTLVRTIADLNTHDQKKVSAPAGDVDALSQWAAAIVDDVVTEQTTAHDARTDRLDAVFTHPVVGLLIFAAVMTGLFMTIFSLASVPMDLIDVFFGSVAEFVGGMLPDGLIHDLIVDGVIAGIAGTAVFLPQICLLFFLISLLEDTGYLARASFVMEGIMRRFGLPGQSFVPFLSAHACAIPAIMSARLIPDRRDRLATILVAPFLSCSARLPVYVLLIGILFPENALHAGLAFAACYLIGAGAALLTAAIFRRTFIKGPVRPMVLELPVYRLPSIRTALATTFDRGWSFLKNAGTVILAICIILWWLGNFPRVEPPSEAVALQTQATAIESSDPDRAALLFDEAEALTARHASASSMVGRIGKTVEPVMSPLGYDWKLTIGVLSSLAAREVFVSTMTVIVSGEEFEDDADVRARLVEARRDDGSLVFNKPTSLSLLVFYILAMQCLPTLAVTWREAGGWKWAALQFGWMSAMAWLLALATYQIAVAAGLS